MLSKLTENKYRHSKISVKIEVMNTRKKLLFSLSEVEINTTLCSFRSFLRMRYVLLSSQYMRSYKPQKYCVKSLQQYPVGTRTSN